MGLDLGLEQAGLHTAVCVEKDSKACATIIANRPHQPLIARKIEEVQTSEIMKAAGLEVGEAFAVVGGPPCQSYSTGGLRTSLRDRRGGLYAEFLRVVEESQPLYFVFENVAQIITAAVKHRPIAERPGQRWHLGSYKEQEGEGGLAPEEQSGSALDVILDAFAELGYSLSFGVLNAANYGVPQRRMRFVLIGSRLNGHVSLPISTHSSDPIGELQPWRTLRDAIGALEEKSPEHANYGERFQSYFRLVPPGGNWRNLPQELQIEALGEKAYKAGGGKTGFFRRLSWDEPTPTIVGKPNRKSSAICHPEEVRPLTVRECACVQGFPVDWIFSGSMHSKYLQIGNAVPVDLGKAVGKSLNIAYDEFLNHPDRNKTIDKLDDWHLRRDQMIYDAHSVIRAAARNKRGRNKNQKELFQI